MLSPLNFRRKGQARQRAKLAHASACVVETLEQRLQLSATLTLSGTQTLTRGTSINVSNQTTAHQAEMLLDVNPANPLNLAGFSHRIGTINEIDVFFTTNGGTTWGTTTIDNADDGLGTGIRFDPSIAFAANGHVFLSYGFNNGSTTRLIIARSTDGGANFGQFRTVDTQTNVGVPGVDKWHLATGLDPNSGNQAVYVTYTQNVNEAFETDQRIVVAGSNDGGNTWTTPVIINDASSGGTDLGNLFADPAVGPNGELYIAWHDINAGTILLDRDLDGLWSGTNGFGTDVTVRTLANGGLFKNYVPAQPDRGIFSGPVLDVDRSGGANNGQLYLAFVEQPSTSSYDTDVLLGRSSNNGTSWTVATVDSANATEFLPWVDVDQDTGSVNLIYYTTDGNSGGDQATVRPRVASSINGGVNFALTNLSTMTSDETDGYFGDYLEYIGIAAHDGTLHGLWSTRNGSEDLEAFTANASTSSANNTLTINGDNGGISTNDTIVVQLSSANSNYIEVLVNGVREFAGLIASVSKIVINGLNGNDTITVASNITLPATINGGAGNDTITGGGGNDSLVGGTGNDTYVYSGTANLGSDTITEADNVDTDTINFTSFGQSAVLDLAQTTSQTVATGKLTLTLSSPTGDGIENVIGSNFADSISGNTRNNSLSGGGGNDTLYGVSGNDTILGGSGNDTIDGGIHDDLLVGGSGNDSIIGSSGNDALYGDAQFYDGLAEGNDTLKGDAGADVIHGDLGRGWANSGSDRLEGGADNDTLYGDGYTFGYGYNQYTQGNDTILGDGGADVIHGDNGFGWDASYGCGYSYGAGSAGNDVINGGSENDTIYGDGNWLLHYGVYLGCTGFPTTSPGGAGWSSTWDGDDNINGDEHNDTIYGDRGTGNGFGGYGYDMIRGSAGNDYLHGEDGNDTYVFGGSTDLGTDTIGETGTAYTDTIDFQTDAFGQGATLNLSTTGNQTVATGKLVLNLVSSTSIENVRGSNFADSLTGNSQNNYLWGFDGNDTLKGGTFHDTLEGGAGDDSMLGESGNDTYKFDGSSNLGSDSITEADNADTDTLDFSSFGQAAVVDMGANNVAQTVSTGKLTLNLLSASGNALENAWGSAFNDQLTGNARSNLIYGNNGNDTIYGLSAADTLYGGAGNDVLDGGTGTDQMFGEGDNDTFIAFDNAVDTIDGGLGTDTVSSSDAGDVITNVP